MRNAPGAEPAAPARSQPAGSAAPTFTSIGGERVYLRAFRRERGRYVPAQVDWTQEFLQSKAPAR